MTNTNLLRGIYNTQSKNVADIPCAQGEDIVEKTMLAANGAPYMIVDASTLPDAHFRAAWSWDENADHPVVIDFDKAKNLTKSAITMRIGGMKVRLTAELEKAVLEQRLEDMLLIRAKLDRLEVILEDPRIEAASTLEKLKLITLEYLMQSND